jgi:hypothetical protein
MAEGKPGEEMLQHALKEWAVICLALAEGRQSLLLRKGGIAETAEDFRLEHTSFWLYPTFQHQHRSGVKSEALPLFEQAERDRPPAGTVRLSHFVEVAAAYQLHDMVGVLKVSDLHLWSDETMHGRFAYRRPGLLALAMRVYRIPEPRELKELDSYAGCKSWVELERPQSTTGASPVLSAVAFSELLRTLNDRLNPTAFA